MNITFEQAQELIEQIFKLINPFIERGITMVGKGHYREGLEEFDKAIELIPDYLFRKDQNNLITAELAQLLEGFATLFFGRAAIKLKLQDYSGAINDYDKALFFDPFNEQYQQERKFAEEALLNASDDLPSC